MRIIHENEKFCIIHKSAGDHIHPPEDRRLKISRDRILLYKVRDTFNKKIYPVHRLDAGTEGLIIFAFDSPTARQMQELIQNKLIKKTYKALIRGHLNFNYLKNRSGVEQLNDNLLKINIPLEQDSTGELVEAHSTLKVLKTLELSDLVGKKNLPAKFTWVELEPVTGRYHQLRRHLNRISHPIIGDRAHGDCHYNKYAKEKFKTEGLMLWATNLNFPWQEQNLSFSLTSSERLQKIAEIISV